MPKSFFLLTAGYVVAYELYYFSSPRKSTGLVDFQQFTPIWRMFMMGGVGLIGYRFLRIFKGKKKI